MAHSTVINLLHLQPLHQMFPPKLCFIDIWPYLKDPTCLPSLLVLSYFTGPLGNLLPLLRCPPLSSLLATNHLSLLPCLPRILVSDARAFFPINYYNQSVWVQHAYTHQQFASKSFDPFHFKDLHSQASSAAPSPWYNPEPYHQEQLYS